MKTLYLMPATGLVIRDPATGRPLPAFGAAVADRPFWRTLRRDKDVLDTTEAAIAAARKAEQPKPAPVVADAATPKKE